jgi:hypothetical protein
VRPNLVPGSVAIQLHAVVAPHTALKSNMGWEGSTTIAGTVVWRHSVL